MWELEGECPAQGHSHPKDPKTFSWPKHSGYVAPEMQVGGAQAQTMHGHCVPPKPPLQVCT